MRFFTRNLIAGVVVLITGTAAAATFNVNLTVDEPDSSPGNGAICYVTDQRGEVRGGDGNGDAISGCDIGAVEATDLVFFDDLEDGSTTWWSAAVGLAP